MRCFNEVKTRSVIKALLLTVLTGVLLVAWAATGDPSQAQSPRPTLTAAPTPTSTPGPTPTPAPTTQAQTSSGDAGPNLKGRVINLSTGELVADVTVIFTTDGVSVEAVTNESGEYAFTLGAANGVLNVVPARESGLKPVTTDVAVRTKTGVETVVNLGVSPNGSGAPPLIPTVRVSPDSVGAGQNMTITVLVKNTLSGAISDAIVTDWLPAGVVPVSIHSSTGNPYFSDNLAVVELGHLDADSGALVEIVVQATGGRTVASRLQGKVSFYYREDAAAQAQALGGLNGTSPTVLPVTGVGLPVMGLFLVMVLVIVGWLRRRVNRTMPAN